MAMPRIDRLVKTKEGRDWLVWLYQHRCKHNHRYIRHFTCYEKEFPHGVIKENVGFLDIEATNLKATFGIVICWCIKPAQRKKAIEACVTKRDLAANHDLRILKELLRVMEHFDRLVVHYGGDGRFDVPFLRSRCLKHGLDFPKYQELWLTDTYPICRKKLKLHSNRLAVVAEFLKIKTKKTPITSEHWLAALQGKQASLDYIVDHCRRDVVILEKVYEKIGFAVPKSKTSL